MCVCVRGGGEISRVKRATTPIKIIKKETNTRGGRIGFALLIIIPKRGFFFFCQMKKLWAGFPCYPGAANSNLCGSDDVR